MRYIRIVVASEDETPLFQRDYDPVEVFSAAVDTFIHEMVDRRLIAVGEHYSAVIIPQYGRSLSNMVHSRSSDAAAPSMGPAISLGFDGEVRPDERLRYFSIEVHVSERQVVLRTDCPMSQLTRFWRSMEPALLRLKVIETGQYYLPHVYAREDDNADLFRERVFAQEEATAGLVELMTEDSVSPTFELRTLKSLNPTSWIQSVAVNGENSAEISLDKVDVHGQDGEVLIVIRRSTLESLRQVAQADVTVEQGGVMVGQVYGRMEGAGYLVEISNYIPAEDTPASVVELRYTFESWQKQTALLRERFPGRRIVGWYHTHLVKMDFPTSDPGEGTITTSLFFSRDDHFMHGRFFCEPWYAALVMDVKGNAAFFRWFGKDIQMSRGFYVSEVQDEVTA